MRTASRNSARRLAGLGAAEIRRVAVEASADPRTVRKVLTGQEVRGMAEARVRQALAKLGLAGAAAAGGAK
jgi:hypothetical protein